MNALRIDRTNRGSGFQVAHYRCCGPWRKDGQGLPVAWGSRGRSHQERGRSLGWGAPKGAAPVADRIENRHERATEIRLPRPLYRRHAPSAWPPSRSSKAQPWSSSRRLPCPREGEFAAVWVDCPGDVEQAFVGVVDIDLDGAGKCSSARFQIQATPSPITAAPRPTRGRTGRSPGPCTGGRRRQHSADCSATSLASAGLRGSRRAAADPRCGPCPPARLCRRHRYTAGVRRPPKPLSARLEHVSGRVRASAAGRMHVGGREGTAPWWPLPVQQEFFNLNRLLRHG